MQKFYRLSAAILIVSLVLLTAPPAQAVHVIAATVIVLGGVLPIPFALTNTGEVYVGDGANPPTWTLVATVPGATQFLLDAGGNVQLLSVQGTTLFRSPVGFTPEPSVGTAVALGTVCSGAPIRSFTFVTLGFVTVHEDGTICFNDQILPGPGEPPVAVEETTWGAVKDTYKFKD